MGTATAPPLGFLAFCEASPSECAGEGASRQALVDVRAWAGQARWTRTFAEAGINVGSPAATDLTPRTPSSSTSADVGAAIRMARAAAKREALKAESKRPPKLRGTAKTRPVPISPDAVIAPAVPEVQMVSHQDLEAVNRRVNRAIRRSTDEATFGQADVWTIPEGPRARGDCEDYALAKRRALIQMGVSPDHLSLAIVRTRAGEIHAVLLAKTRDGEFVLDNLSPWVVRWDSAPYEWLERQVPGAPTDWVKLDFGRA